MVLLRVQQLQVQVHALGLGVVGHTLQAVGHGVDGCHLVQMRLTVPAEHDQTGDSQRGRAIDRRNQLPLDSRMVRSLVQPVGQRLMTRHAGHHQAMLTRRFDELLEIVARRPQLHRRIADLGSVTQQRIQAHTL